MATRPRNLPERSIIDLIMTTPKLGYLPVLKIEPELATPSDHKCITFDFENLDKDVGNLGPSTELSG